VIADATDPDATQTILADLKQGVLPGGARWKKSATGPQNDLFAAS
jgi:hypothetical protein